MQGSFRKLSMPKTASLSVTVADSATLGPAVIAEYAYPPYLTYLTYPTYPTYLTYLTYPTFPFPTFPP
jgi:hypothetical protein